MKKLFALSIFSSYFLFSSNPIKADFTNYSVQISPGDTINVYTCNENKVGSEVSIDNNGIINNNFCTLKGVRTHSPGTSLTFDKDRSYIDKNNNLVLWVREGGKSKLVKYDGLNNEFTDLGTNWQSAYDGSYNTQLIRQESDGSIHIGENSAVFKEENGREKFWAQDANGNSIPIDITNGSKLLINGRDVEQSINNVGALSAALTGLPTVPTDTNLACGLGTGTHGGDIAFSGGCASKVNEKLSINYAASVTMPGQDYAGDFEDKFSARAGFVWKLGKATKPAQISMKETKELKQEISDLKNNNNQIISQNKSLLTRLERLEKLALGETKSKDLATIKLP